MGACCHRRIPTNGADGVTAESSQFARISFRSADPGPESPKSPIGPDRSPSIPPDSSPDGEAVRLNRPIGREFGRSGCERSGGPRIYGFGGPRVAADDLVMVALRGAGARRGGGIGAAVGEDAASRICMGGAALRGATAGGGFSSGSCGQPLA